MNNTLPVTSFGTKRRVATICPFSGRGFSEYSQKTDTEGCNGTYGVSGSTPQLATNFKLRAAMTETERKNASRDVGSPKIAQPVVTNTYVTIPKEQWDRIESTLETIAKRLSPDDKIITMAKACELLGVTDTTFRKYRRKFNIPVSQVGRNILLHESDIEFLIKDRLL